VESTTGTPVNKKPTEKHLSAWQEWVHHPEKLAARQAVFHVHLWLGVSVGLYIALMSTTGIVLVFRNQLPAARFMFWLVDLHTNLLLGMNGRLLNGIGALCVLALCLTGAVTWWPGVLDWRRALTLKWPAPCPRFTWDLHSALGFWFLLFVLMWGTSGLYFAFPGAFNTFFCFMDPKDRFTDQTLLWLSLLHFGRFSLFTEAIWALLGAVPAVLALSGIFLCCRRLIYKTPHHRPE
jgi:uncharacterized iron-regulated membrane protein